MNLLKLICLTFIQRIKQVCLLPQTIAQDARQRRREQINRDELEIERLDRIRNPSRYRGK